MKLTTIRQTATFDATPHAVYAALLDAQQHSAFTSSKATISPEVGGKFTAFDGYAEGEVIELIPDEKIVLEWRAAEPHWPEAHYSTATFSLQATGAGTRLTFTQNSVPAVHAKDIAKGWKEYYWTPLKHFLSPS